MENSVLSDAAGIQTNISKMYENYASSIGKSTDALTQAEKAQAVYNGVMAEAADFAGSAEEMASGYQGTQAQLNASTLELSRTLGETMTPILNEINQLWLSLTQNLNSFMEGNKGATSGIITFVATLGTLTVAITAVKKAYNAYKTSALEAKVATEGFSAVLASNPVGIAITAVSTLAAVFVGLKTVTDEQKEAQQQLTEAQEFYNSVLKDTIELTDSNITTMETKLEEMQNYIADLNEYTLNLSIEQSLPRLIDSAKTEEDAEKYKQQLEEIKEKNKTLRESLEETSDGFKKMYEIEKDGLVTADDLSGKIEVYTEKLDEATAMEKIKEAMDTSSIKTQQQEAAQLKLNVSQMQSYLDIVKKGKTSTSEYQTAVKKLAEAYPEAANAEGIIIDKAQDYINAEKAEADQSWNTVQQIIQGNTDVINSYIKMAEAAEGNVTKQQELANTIGIAYNDIIPTLTSVLNILNAIGQEEPEEVGGTGSYYTPRTISSGSSSSNSYSNKALDNYKKQIEYKKSLDKISLKEEIKMYETALKKYAKTTDEKNDLRVKIYELNKEMAQKEKDLLDEQTEDYETYIQKQKNAKGASYDVKEQEKDYDKIIKLHQKYLKEIMKDERLSLEERKQIYREELQTIRDYEQQKRDLRVEQIDNTVTQLTNAVTKQLEEMQEKDKEMIDANIEAVEEWKKFRINAINEEYDARIEAINKELEALDKAEQQKTRDEEDAEYETKRQRLQELVDFEHDATTKANYQKELDKLLAEYQETLDDRALEDKKEALNAQKDLLQQEQDDKIQAVEDEAENQKEVYEKQLDSIEEYYENQINSAQDTAEKMLLNVEDNQKTILNLLKNYGDDYEITGQTLGEKLAQGINDGLTGKIENVITKIQESIDKGIENKIGEMTSGTYKYTAGSNKPTVTNVTNVTQQNYIQQMQEMPSETYRKLNDVSQKLAAELSV